MSHILIGGSARCGKSTLAKTVTEAIPVQFLSGDALRTTLRKTTPYGTFPALHVERAEKITPVAKFVAHHTIHVYKEIESKREQAGFMWPFIENYLRGVEHESGNFVLAESIDIWPDLIALSGIAHRAVFLVDTSTEQAERIISSRGVDPNDWMHQNNYTDTMIEAWSFFNAQRSREIQDLAKQAGYLCVDLAEVGFTEAQEIASQHLID